MGRTVALVFLLGVTSAVPSVEALEWIEDRLWLFDGSQDYEPSYCTPDSSELQTGCTIAPYPTWEDDADVAVVFCRQVPTCTIEADFTVGVWWWDGAQVRATYSRCQIVYTKTLAGATGAATGCSTTDDGVPAVGLTVDPYCDATIEALTMSYECMFANPT